MCGANAGHCRPRASQDAALAAVCLVRIALVAFLALAAAFASPARAASSDPAYRLAGIVGDDSGRSIAVIELPDGRQRLVRAGDVLGDGTIAEITPISVRIELPGEDLILRMRGNPRLAAAVPRTQAPPVAAVAGEVEEEEEGDAGEMSGDGGVRNQLVSIEEAARMLEATQHAGEQAGGDASGMDAGRRLNALLEIPEEATVVEVDGVRVDSPRAAIAAIQSSLQQSSSARVTVTDAGALTTLVLAADSEQ